MNADSQHDPPPPASPPSATVASDYASWGLFMVLLAYAVFTRLYHLGAKPIQHDESMFAYYAYLITQGHSYEFMPILHGPLLEWATAGLFRLFRDSDATMRLFPALCGIGIVITLWGLRRTMGTRAALLAITFTSLSPTLLFFSRFCRNDLPFLFMAMIVIWGLTSFARRHSRATLMLAILAGALAVTIKETYVIFFFILSAFAIACAVRDRVQTRKIQDSAVAGHVLFAVLRRPFALALAGSLGAFLVVALYSAFFHYPEHRDGVIEGLRYWAEEHKKHRIEGPFHFYLIHLAIYELPFLLFWAGALIYRFWHLVPDQKHARTLRTLQWIWLALSLVLLGLFWNRELPEAFDDVAHMTLGLHLWLAAELVLIVCVVCWKHLNRERPFLAFADCWTGASLVIYSYAGEKVPWVTAHIALPLAISCALHADELLTHLHAAYHQERRRASTLLRWSGAALACIGLGWTMWLGLFLAFVNSGNPIERHTYASTHPQFHRAVQQVIDEALDGVMGFDTRIAFKGEVAWPLWWSLRKFYLKTPEVYAGTYPPFAIIDEYEYQVSPEYLDDYTWKRVRFRHYWQPRPLDWKAMARIDLMLRPEEGLSDDHREQRQRALNEWLKLAKATFLRLEDIQGPTRWEYLGGLDAYIGRLKPGIGPQA